MANALPILMIAGPSGAGKSTLIALLRNGQLPDEITRELPPDAAHWPLIPSFAKNHVSQISGGTIIHYDTTHIIRAKLSSHDLHPAALKLREAQDLIIIDVRPNMDQLIAQFSSRKGAPDTLWRRAHVWWKRAVREPLLHLKNRLKGSGNLRETRAIYRDRELIERCYAEWDRHIPRLLEGKAQSRVLRVAPTLDQAGRPSFRLIA